MYHALLLVVIMVVGACCVHAGEGAAPLPGGVQITPLQDGGFAVVAPAYQAQIGADGNLHSISVNGVEFLDDHVANTPGASFVAEQPIALPAPTVQQSEIEATDGVYTVRYRLSPTAITLVLRHTNPQGAAFALVSSARIAFVEDQLTKTVSATPADYHWPNVKVTATTGEFLILKGGTRVWGHEIDRQVWECSNLAPNKDYVLTIIPGRGTPPTPDLSQLTRLSATMSTPTQLIPAGEEATLQLQFDNNSTRPMNSEMVLHIESTQGKVLLKESKPFTCDPHRSATLTWSVKPTEADFYRVTCFVNLDGTPKVLKTTFGYDLPAIQYPVQRPADFDAYWDRVVAEAKAAKVRLIPSEDVTRSTSKVRVYSVGIEVDGVQQFFGWLSVPKYHGRYPGLLILPSDRVRTIGPNPALAEDFIVLSVEPTRQSVQSALKPLITQASVNLTNPSTFGMRMVMIRYLQAVTALASMADMPEFNQVSIDPYRIAVTGAGLGGGLAMILGTLDNRVQAVAPDVPYYVHIELNSGRPDWPYFEVIDFLRKNPTQRDAVMKTLSYYDAANFADRLDCPVYISAGLNDLYSCPQNIVGTYNLIPGPKAISIYLAGHEGGLNKHWEEKMRWLSRTLGPPSPPGPMTPLLPPPGGVKPVDNPDVPNIPAVEEPMQPAEPVKVEEPKGPAAPEAPAVEPPAVEPEKPAEAVAPALNPDQPVEEIGEP